MRIAAVLLVAAALVGAALIAEAEEPDAKPPLKVHMISGSKEYQSEPSLKAYKEYLEKHFNVRCTLSLGQDGGKDLPGLEALDSSDVMLVFCRRMKLPEDQLARIKAWCEAGKPVVGLRTASHAFQPFLEFDKQVLGGDYKGHGGGETVEVKIVEKNAKHPILAGVTPWKREGKLYRNPAIAEDCTLLLTGTGEKSGDTQPLAWCRIYNAEKKGRSFYTGMGYPHDFENENFLTLVTNALFWVADRPVERAAAETK